METQRRYYETPSAEPFAASLLEIRPHNEALALILDATVFYPEGGGQPADRGTVNGVPLLDVQERDGEILHIVAAGEGRRLQPGPAELILDRARQRDFTTLHTAQHLLSGTLLRMTGAHTVSMHLGDEVCTIDVAAKELTEATLVEVEEAAADAIEANQPVIIHLCPPERVEDFPLRKVPPQGEEAIRVVEIAGNDFSPCCGTHLSSTGEIGILRILGAEKYKGMTRVSFIAGRRVLRDSRILWRNAGIISRSLKVPPAETSPAVAALLEKTALLERKLKALEEDAAARRADALLAGKNAAEGTVLVESFPDADMEEVLRIGRAAQKRCPAVLALAAPRELKFAGLCSVKSLDIRPLFQGILEQHGGKGGGGPSFFQGQFSRPEDLAAFLAAIPDAYIL
ncbi:MAG: alanyl-tRNA editing protein [Treponema sp.]|jgi:alanyl-tRNA synthetase|nr:alanyl-tRNA editing protein [Treponema sp.]